MNDDGNSTPRNVRDATAKGAKGPLDGIRILDLTRILAGPTMTQTLGDFGADVIKIERPGFGDDTRSWGPPYVTGGNGEPTTESAYYLAANRNKRSVAVDIATEDGADLIRKLARRCDAVVENFKVGGLAKYGLDHDTLSAGHPGLVYCSITGFGQTGPNAHRPGYDLLAQGYGGIMSLTGEPDGEPMKVGVGIADVVCGLYGGLAILAALRHRDRTGLGQHIDVSLVDAQISWLVNEGSNYLVSGEEPKRRGNQHPNIVPYQVFRAADGHVIVAAGNDGQYRRLCELVGLSELADDPRFSTNPKRLENREILIGLLAEKIAAFGKRELVAGMEERNVPGGIINTVSEALESEQAIAREMKITMPHGLAASGEIELIGSPVKFGRTPVTYRHAPPQCGEHTEEVLREILGEDGGDAQAVRSTSAASKS